MTPWKMHCAIGIKVSGQSQIHPNPLSPQDHPTTLYALDSAYKQWVQNPGCGNLGPEPSHTLDHASGGRSSGIASFARRTETSSEPGSHQSMRSWARMIPPTTILQLSPERFSSALNTFLAIRFSR
jgi:hypothetical protein